MSEVRILLGVHCGECSSVGRALDCGSSCREFKSRHSPIFFSLAMKKQRPFSHFLCHLLIGTSLFFTAHSVVFAGEETKSHHRKNWRKSFIVRLKASIIEKKKHPFRAFTQGLTKINNKIYESSGMYGQSFIVEYSLENPLKTARKKKLPPFIFAEGIASFHSKLHSNKEYGDPKKNANRGNNEKNNDQETQIFLLTWKENRFFSLSNDFSKEMQSSFYDREGWGITFDGKYFITSEGTHVLTFRDKSLNVLKNKQNGQIVALNVHKNQQKVEKINELEYAPLILENGKEIFLIANVWGSDFLAAIDKKGNVIAEIDCRNLSKENRPKESIQQQWGVLSEKSHQKSSFRKKAQQYKKVLNGVALLSKKKDKKLKNAQFLVTGKRWEWIYVVQFSPIL